MKHISEVWNYLREAKTKDELEERIGDIPNKFGDWDIEKTEDGRCRVINYYYDELCENWDEDCEDLDIMFEEEEDND